jgi:hypothetical protein
MDNPSATHVEGPCAYLADPGIRRNRRASSCPHSGERNGPPVSTGGVFIQVVVAAMPGPLPHPGSHPGEWHIDRYPLSTSRSTKSLWHGMTQVSPDSRPADTRSRTCWVPMNLRLADRVSPVELGPGLVLILDTEDASDPWLCTGSAVADRRRETAEGVVLR